MSEPRTIVCWPRVGRPGLTLWHANAPIAADDHGRTECGKDWPRKDAQVKPTIGTEGIECANCRRALEGTVPGTS